MLNDEDLMPHVIKVAERSVANGNHPFACILVSPEGEVLLEAENTVVTTGDRTGHSERNLATAASMKYSEEYLNQCSIYINGEPCAMCSGSIYWSGIGRVVYGFTEEQLLECTGNHPENPTCSLSCDTVLNSGQRKIEIIGGVLAEECLKPHYTFWQHFA